MKKEPCQLLLGSGVRSGSESEESCTPEEHVVCRDQTREERVTFHTSQEDGALAYKCQGLTLATKSQERRYLDLVPVIFSDQEREVDVREISVQTVGKRTMVVQSGVSATS